MKESGTGHAPMEFWSSLESKSGCERLVEGEETPWLVRWLAGELVLTGNVPWAWMCLRDLVMSGMERASAQSQSRRPFFVGSLGNVSLQREVSST